MYISYLGPKGALHLAKEAINNNIDEAINPKAPHGVEIDIYVDEPENTITTSDTGRGIPFDMMETAVTKLQSSSKFVRSGTGGSAGENGAGMKTITALSSQFEIISKRYNEKASLLFKNGKKVGEMTVKKIDSDKHGTMVKFTPNPYYLGDCQFPTDDLVEWLTEIVHLVPPSIKINLFIEKKGKEASVKKKFQNKNNGLEGLCKKMCEKTTISPIHVVTATKAVEQVRDETFDRFIGLELAFTYKSAQGTEPIINSYCNFVKTVDHGQHLNGVRQGMVNIIKRLVEDSMSDKEKEKLDIIPNDIMNGIVLAAYVSTDYNPHFTGQTKEKVGNEALFKPVRDMTFRALKEYFSRNPKALKKVVDYVKTNAKIRTEMNKTRAAVVKGTTDRLSEFAIKNYTPANNSGKNDYRELIIIEGESAAGTAKNGRIKDSQAIFYLKGVPSNSFDKSIFEILSNTKNPEFKRLIEVLGCGVGKDFDIEKCKFDKIIIMTDADIDGNNIFSLTATFFIVHLPALVQAGMIYKSITPLYRLRYKKKEFVLSKQDYIDVFEERIGDNIKIVDPKTKEVIPKKDFKQFLLNNRTYLEDLDRLANHYAIHRDVAEFICIHLPENLKKMDKFEKMLKKRFPEVTIEDDHITGIYEGKFQFVRLSNIDKKRFMKVIKQIHVVNSSNAYYTALEKVSGEYRERDTMTIGALMTLCQKFQPDIETRFKGLGEMNPDQLLETTLDPNKRSMYKLVISDFETELAKFNILHGEKGIEQRKELMAHFSIDREDLDN